MYSLTVYESGFSVCLYRWKLLNGCKIFKYAFKNNKHIYKIIHETMYIHTPHTHTFHYQYTLTIFRKSNTLKTPKTIKAVIHNFIISDQMG